MAAGSPETGLFCPSRVGGTGCIGFAQLAIFIRANSAFCIRAGRLNDHRNKAGCSALLARRIGVRDQFGDAPLATSKAPGRIGIRPQICYALPIFGTVAPAGQLLSGDFRDANWPLSGRLKFAQQVAAVIDLFITQIGFQHHFQCAHAVADLEFQAAGDFAPEQTTVARAFNCAHAVADLGSDPNSVRGFQISGCGLPELGSDPNSAGQPDGASVSVAQSSERFAMRANTVQPPDAIYLISGSAYCIRAGCQNDHQTKAGCSSLLDRRIGVRAQFGDARLAKSTVPGRIGIRPQICYALPEFGVRAIVGQWLAGGFRGANWLLQGRLNPTQQAVAADKSSMLIHRCFTATEQATS